MKKVIVPPAIKENTLQAIIDYLVDNGMPEFGANIFIHTNLPVLGDNVSLLNCIQDNRWDEAWTVAQAYIAGDYF